MAFIFQEAAPDTVPMRIYCKIDGFLSRWDYEGEGTHIDGIAMVRESLNAASGLMAESMRPKVRAILAVIQGGKR